MPPLAEALMYCFVFLPALPFYFMYKAGLNDLGDTLLKMPESKKEHMVRIATIVVILLCFVISLTFKDRVRGTAIVFGIFSLVTRLIGKFTSNQFCENGFSMRDVKAYTWEQIIFYEVKDGCLSLYFRIGERKDGSYHSPRLKEELMDKALVLLKDHKVPEKREEETI